MFDIEPVPNPARKRPRLQRGNQAGHHFHDNGDLSVSWHAGPVILTQRYGFRRGVKVLLDSYCEDACPECGCPQDRYHAYRCSRGPNK